MPKITSAEDLIGKTITAVLKSRTGRKLVLAIGDEDFCVIAIDLCFCEDAQVCMERTQPSETILDVCSPADLFFAQLISREKFDFLDANEKQAVAERKRKHAAKLLADAEKLEART